mmetsp:Transcript_70936/g.154116  ORF Transcript_70936/g.154116 Transcript_70936/m.154116 type:complete len:275 (+) Transcript_70936:710-1534(+)
MTLRAITRATSKSEMPMYWKNIVMNEKAAPGTVPNTPCRMITQKVGILMKLFSFRISLCIPRRWGLKVGGSSWIMEGIISMTDQLKAPVTASANLHPSMPKTFWLEIGVTKRQASNCPRFELKYSHPKTEPRSSFPASSATKDWTTGSNMERAAPLKTLRRAIDVSVETKASRNVQSPQQPEPITSSIFLETPLSTRLPHIGPVAAALTPWQSASSARVNGAVWRSTSIARNEAGRSWRSAPLIMEMTHNVPKVVLFHGASIHARCRLCRHQWN